MKDTLSFLLILFNKKKEEVDYDWMGFKVTESNPITTYHIKKYSTGGEDSVDNCAVISELAQRYLNFYIARTDIDIYNSINDILLEFNKRRIYPTLEEIETINNLLTTFEERHSKELGNKLRFVHFNEKRLRKMDSSIDIYNPTSFRLVLQSGIDPIKKKIKR